MSKPITIGVYICAYNEERNIRNIINLLLAQEGTLFSLEKILVISDGSMDRTASFARSVHDPRIEVREYIYNRGLTACINEALGSFSTDVLIKIDADVEQLSKNMCEMVAHTIIHNPQAGCICFRNILTLTSTNSLLAQAHIHGRTMWETLKKSISTQTVYNVSGIIYALSREIYTRMRLPKNLIDEDWYAGFFTVQNNKEIVPIDSIVVAAREETHFLRIVRQFSRHLTPQSPDLFSADIVTRIKPPIERLQTKIFLKNMLRRPILTTTYISMRMIGKIHSLFHKTPLEWK